MEENRVYVRDLKEYFKFRQVAGDDYSLNRWIVAPDINRPGLELTGYDQSTDLKRVIVIGNKENKYLANIDFEERKNRYQIITDAYTPCIVISNGKKADQALIEVANSKNFPVFESDEETFRISTNISSYLDEKLAITKEYHGVLMNIYGIGVLFQGESGVGKSELALELIKRGHILIGDDLISIKKVHNELYGEANELLKNYLEIRGVGIIDVPLMFGASAILDRTNISLVIKLKRYDEKEDMDRLETKGYKKINIMEMEMPLMELPVKEGRAMGAICEAAVANYRLYKQGFNSSEEFCQSVKKFIEARQKDK